MTTMTSKIMSGFVIICYLSLGLWLILSSKQIFTIPLFQQRILGVIFVVFAIVRGIMFYTKFKRSQLAQKEQSKKSARKNTLKCLACLVIVSFITSCSSTQTDNKQVENTVSSGEVSIVVDQSLKPIMEAEIQAFESIYTQAKIKATYLPEAEAVNSLINDSSKLAVLCRPLTSEEKDLIKQQKIYTRNTLVGRGAICLIVNNKNPDSTISLVELREIFGSEKYRWDELNSKGLNDSINIIFANKNASTVQYIKDSISDGKMPKNAFALSSNGKVIDYVSQNEKALGIIGVSWISDTNNTKVRGFLKKVKVVGISRTGYDAAYKPYQAFIANLKYPLTRKMYFESREARTGLATGFASFVAGQKGQSVILKGGLVPATMPVRIVEFSK